MRCMLLPLLAMATALLLACSPVAQAGINCHGEALHQPRKNLSRKHATAAADHCKQRCPAQACKPPHTKTFSLLFAAVTKLAHIEHEDNDEHGHGPGETLVS